MNRLILMLFLLSNCIFSQINFEKGYFIDNKGIKTDCYIKNKTFNENQKTLKYKLNSNEKELKEIDISEVKEIGIENLVKYVKKEVKIDISNQTSLNNLSENRDPIWENKILLLKVLVEGKANLYEYFNNNPPKYFYNLDDASIEQLIYKKYYINDPNNSVNNSTVASNKDFQKQLFEKLNHKNEEASFFIKINYKRNSLVDYFKDFNLYKNNSVIHYKGNTTNSSLNFKFQSGIMKSNLKDHSSENHTVTYSKNNPFLTIGAEIEYLFLKNKWSTFLNTNFQKFNYKIKTVEHYNPDPIFDRVYIADVDINYLAIYLGLKHYMYLNKNSSFYIGLSFRLNEINNIKTQGETNNHNYDIPLKNLILGYSYKSKFFFETRDGNSLILSYKLFDSNKKKSSK